MTLEITNSISAEPRCTLPKLRVLPENGCYKYSVILLSVTLARTQKTSTKMLILGLPTTTLKKGSKVHQLAKIFQALHSS